MGRMLSALALILVIFTMFNHYSVSGAYEKPVICVFGDSNSDTGGAASASGALDVYPYGRLFHHIPSGRACDGRLVIDFLCENVTASYLTPYMYSLAPNFENGANFAVSGATIMKTSGFYLDIQINQFTRFHNLSIELYSHAGEFDRALYLIDIGQNDLYGAFTSHSYTEVLELIPTYIASIKKGIMALYKEGARKFWIHNTGPLGCLPVAINAANRSREFDKYGCVKILNEAAMVFNLELNVTLGALRKKLVDSNIVYVDMFAIKYSLIANSDSYGFINPLEACCKHCGRPGMKVCNEKYISWDGIHYTEAANSVIASKVLSTKFNMPPLPFNYFLHH